MRKEVYDLAYVTTVTGDFETSVAMSSIFNKLGLSVCIFTANYFDHLAYLKLGISSYYISPYLSREWEVEKISPPKYTVDCEHSYYRLPKFFLNYFSRNLRRNFHSRMRHICIKKFLQFPGGEILRQVVNQYCEEHLIKQVVIGESFHIGSDKYSVLYGSLNKQCFYKSRSVVEEKKITVDGRAIKKYQKPLSPQKKGLMYFVRVLDAYPAMSAIGYRIRRSIGFMRTRVIRFLVNELPSSSDVLLLLNVQAESELYICNKEYTNPLTAIKEVQKRCPGSKMYIKGHPGWAKSFSLYQAIAMKVGGISILDSSIPASSILSRFSKICFVSSSVGRECIDRDIPFHVLGNWPYYKFLNTVDQDKEQSTKQIFYSNLLPNLHRGSLYDDSQDFEMLLKEVAIL